MTPQRAFLANGACPVTTCKRLRSKPSYFEAGATRLHGSRKLEKRPAPPRDAPCPPVPPNSVRSGNAERVRRREAARCAYTKAIEEPADKTFLDLSWEQRRIMAVCSYARALSCSCTKMSFRLIAPLTPYCDRGNVKITRDPTTRNPPPPISHLRNEKIHKPKPRGFASSIAPHRGCVHVPGIVGWQGWLVAWGEHAIVDANRARNGHI